MIVCWMPLMRVCLLFRPFRSLHQCSIYLHCSYCQCGVCFNERFAPPSLASSLSLSFRVALWGMPWWAVRSPISAPFFFFYFSIKSSNQPVQPTPKGFKPKLKKMNLLTSRIHTMGKGMIDTLHSSIHSNWWIVKIRGLPTSMDWCKWKSKIWRLFGMFALSSLWLKSLSQMSGFEVCWDWPSWRQIQWCLHNLGVERMATVSNAVGVKGMNWSMSSFFNAIQVLIFSKYRSNELSANWNPDRKLFQPSIFGLCWLVAPFWCCYFMGSSVVFPSSKSFNLARATPNHSPFPFSSRDCETNWRTYSSDASLRNSMFDVNSCPKGMLKQMNLQCLTSKPSMLNIWTFNAQPLNLECSTSEPRMFKTPAELGFLGANLNTPDVQPRHSWCSTSTLLMFNLNTLDV